MWNETRSVFLHHAATLWQLSSSWTCASSFKGEWINFFEVRRPTWCGCSHAQISVYIWIKMCVPQRVLRTTVDKGRVLTHNSQAPEHILMKKCQKHAAVLNNTLAGRAQNGYTHTKQGNSFEKMEVVQKSHPFVRAHGCARKKRLFFHNTAAISWP